MSFLLIYVIWDKAEGFAYHVWVMRHTAADVYISPFVMGLQRGKSGRVMKRSLFWKGEACPRNTMSELFFY